ncbi:hypothetical protein, partial [Vibrio diazotrophicus]|uniref:hypothetical protein n=1 Tax=Vibrio diazotrophicus TaxID=685 RepID=UPI001C3F325E
MIFPSPFQTTISKRKWGITAIFAQKASIQFKKTKKGFTQSPSLIICAPHLIDVLGKLHSSL